MGRARHDGFGEAGPKIGPNAILQLVPVLDAALGADTRRALMHLAEVDLPPPDAGMWPEDEVARLHHMLRLCLPDRAADLARAAGQGVAAYILANRIPRPAQALIRALPAPLGARVLSAAIARNAWTFAGSGRFRITGRRPITVEIAANPLVALDHAAAPQCHWHAAVFEGLFRALVSPRARVRETACCACGDPACRFVLSLQVDNLRLPDSGM